MSDTELKYFKDSWKPDYSKFKYSGWALLDKIKDTDMILDIGCGYNLFKENKNSTEEHFVVKMRKSNAK